MARYRRWFVAGLLGCILHAAAWAEVPAFAGPRGELFTIQIGSFKGLDDARATALRAAAAGVEVRVVEVLMEGRRWFRVQTGELPDRREAEEYYQRELKPRGLFGFVTPVGQDLPIQTFPRQDRRVGEQRYRVSLRLA